MNLQALIRFCRALPYTVEDIKWGHDLVFSIKNGKMFCVFSMEDNTCNSVSFKVDEHRFLEMTDRPQFIPAPYMARARWVAMVEFSGVSIGELKQLVGRSYQLYFEKLPKKAQRQFRKAQRSHQRIPA